MSNHSPNEATFDVSMLPEVARLFQTKVSIQDRKYHLKTYKQCFLGSEAVNVLIQSGFVSTRSEAVALGQLLQSELYLFEHVTRDHPLLDEDKFYRFVPENERGTVARNAATGQKFDWTDFLAPTVRTTAATHAGDSLQPHWPLPDLEAVSSKDAHVAGKVWPLDQHNTTLLNNVHPAEWQDPMPNQSDGSSHYDMVVIGGGTAGLITASGSAGVGARVAMIEEHMLGGDCLNVGCVPSKTLLHSARLAHTVRGDLRRLQEAGITVDPKAVQVDFEKIMERVRKIRGQISHHDSAERYSKELGVEVYIGRGKFTSEKTVEVNGRTLTFKRAAIATGGYPTLIPMDGLKELYEEATWGPKSPDTPRPIVMTNETIFNLTKAPKIMAVIGAGVIGMEMAQAMQRLGVDTIVLGRSGRVLPKEDADLANIVQRQMTDDGVEFLLNVGEYQKIEKTGRTLDNGYQELMLTFQERGKEEPTLLICDALLVAAGRRPNVTGMDLELAKVEYDIKKGLIVNDRLQTTNPKIFGVGDCCSEYKFTHAADFMARAVIRNALFLGKDKMSNLLIPYATFTSPEIASVGLYEADLKAKGIEFRVFEKHFANNDRAIADDETVGMVRIRVDAKTDKILGASIVGNNAGNMISEITLAMQSGTGLGSLANVIHPYPTTAEAIRQAGDLYNRTKLTTTAKTLLRGIIQIQR